MIGTKPEFQPTPEATSGPPTSRSLLACMQRSMSSLVNGREIWALADQALVSATNFATNVMAARSLGLSGYGIFALAWMAVIFFASIQMALVIAPMMSLGPKTASHDRASYYGAAIVQELGVVLLATLLLLFGIDMVARFSHYPSVEHLALPLAAAMIAYMLQDFIRRYLFVTRQSRRAFINDAVSCLPQLPLLFIMFRMHQIDVSGALWIMAITSILGVGSGIVWFERVTFSKRALRLAASRHWNISRWLAPSAVLSWTSTNFIGLLAPVYYGTEAAGALRASQNLVAVAHIWFLGLDNVMPAETAHRLHTEGLRSASRYLRTMSLRWGTITAAFLLILSVAPQFWLRLAYGEQYADYAYTLPMYGLIYLVLFFGRPITAGLQAIEFTSPILWAYCLLTGFAVLIGPPLTRHAGIPGVMLGTLLVQILFHAILGSSLFVRFRSMLAQDPIQLERTRTIGASLP